MGEEEEVNVWCDPFDPCGYLVFMMAIYGSMNGSGKVGQEARQDDNYAFAYANAVGQGGYWGKVKQSTLKFAGQNS